MKGTIETTVIKRKDYGRVSSYTTYTLKGGVLDGKTYQAGSTFKTVLQVAKYMKSLGYTDITRGDKSIEKMNY